MFCCTYCVSSRCNNGQLVLYLQYFVRLKIKNSSSSSTSNNNNNNNKFIFI